MGPVVLLQLHELDRHVRPGEIALEVLHVRDVRAAERVDRLVVVADREHRRIGAGQELQPLVLQDVRVLELVDEQVREAAAIMLAQAVALREELVASQQQLGEIDHAFALAHRVVERVVLDQAPRELVARLDLVRAQALLLRPGNEMLQLPRRKPLVVDAVRLVQPLDQRELVLRVHDLEELRQVRVAVMRAQHPVAEAVERADPHPAHVDRRHRRQAHQHLLRRLVRERDGENRQRRRLTGREQPREARGQHARLAAAGAGQDQRRSMRQRDGGELLGVEVCEKGSGHGAGRSIIRVPGAIIRARSRRAARRRGALSDAAESHRRAARPFRDHARVRPVDPFGGAVHPRVSRQDVRHRVRRRGRRGRHVSRHHPRPEPAAQPRRAPRRRARIAAADRGDSRAAGHREPLRVRPADHRRRDDGLRARGRRAGALAHRGAALARHRELADGGRAHPRFDRQFHHGQAARRARRHRHAAHGRGAPRGHRGDAGSASTTATSC